MGSSFDIMQYANIILNVFIKNSFEIFGVANDCLKTPI